jgi:hypothetical protein
MDSGAAKDGDLDAPQPPAILASAQNTGMKCENTIILGTDPFMIMLLIRYDYVAYPFTHQLFDKIVTLGNLK